MNACVVLGVHGSMEEILKKAGGNAGKVSEILLLRKYAGKFDNVFLMSHDSKNFEGMLPDNCRHVRTRNRLFHLLFGWIVLLLLNLRYSPKVIRVVGSSALPALFLTGWLTGSKVILKYYYLWYNTASGKLKRSFIFLLENMLLTAVDHVIAANNEVRRFAGSGKVLDINEGIITSQFDPKKTGTVRKIKSLKGVKLIFVGRLENVKDPLIMLRAYGEAKKTVKDIKLVVCGDGPLMKECRKLADKDVHFLGFVGNVPELLNSSDIYVITSKYDASPRSLMEAMCMGLPTIATRVGGIPEYLTEGSGLLVDTGNVEAFSESIVNLSKSKTLRSSMGSKARKLVLDKYNLEKELEKELKFISKTIK